MEIVHTYLVITKHAKKRYLAKLLIMNNLYKT